MRKRKSWKCLWCLKEFRSDYVGQHERTCTINPHRMQERLECCACSVKFETVGERKSHEKLCIKLKGRLPKKCTCKPCKKNCKERIILCFCCTRQCYIKDIKKHVAECVKKMEMHQIR